MRLFCALALVALVSFGSGDARAAADLELSVSWELIPDTYQVTFSVTVKNVGDTPMDPAVDAPQQYVDVMVFPDYDAQPDPAQDGNPELWYMIPALGPGESYTTPTTVDYGVAGTYSAWVMVDTIAFSDVPEYAVPEDTKNNNMVGPIIIDLSPAAQGTADLTITALDVTVNQAQAKFSVTVQNKGDTLAPSGFKVDVLFDAPTCPPPGWTALPSTLFGDVFKDVPDALAANKSTVVDLVATPPAGTHQACAVVDLDNVVSEANLSNNVYGSVTYTIAEIAAPPAPDLDITVFSVQSLAGTVTYSVTVENKGDAPSGPFTLDLYYHGLTAPILGEPVDHFWPVPSLAPNGGSWSGEHQQTTGDNGSYKAWVWADKEQATTDSYLENNQEGPYPYIVNVTGAIADLRIDEVVWQVIDGNIQYDVTIQNQGTAPVSNVDVDMFYSYETNPDCLEADLSNTPHDYMLIDALEPGGFVTLPFTWNAPPDGDHMSWVKVDCFSNIDELDDTNNTYGPVIVSSQGVVTTGADLKMELFQGKVSCTQVSYVVEVENVGDAATGPFQIDIFYDSELNPNFVPPGDFTFILEDGLAAGETYTLTHNRPNSAPSGSYRSWAVTDTALEIDETSEGNNISFVEIVVDQEACRCPENLEIEEACYCAGETVFEGHCCNDEWQYEPFENCVPPSADGDQPGGDAGPSQDAGGGTGGVTGGDLTPGGVFSSAGGNDQRFTDSGCTATGGTPTSPLATFGLVLLLLLGLRAQRVHRSAPQPIRERRRPRK